MATSGGSLKFVVEVAADDATKVLTALSTAVNQAGVSMKTTFAGVEPGARSAARALDGTTNSLKGFINEQRSQARYAGFVVREMADLTTVSGSTKIALEGVVGALAGGFGIGAALDLALTGIKLLVAELRASEKVLEDIDKKSAERSRKNQERLEELRVKRFPAGTRAVETAQEAQFALDTLREQQAILKSQLAEPIDKTRPYLEIVRENDARRERLALIERQIPALEREIVQQRTIAREELANAGSLEEIARAQQAVNQAHYAKMKAEADLRREAERYRESEAQRLEDLQNKGMGPQFDSHVAQYVKGQMRDEEEAQKRIKKAAEETEQAYRRWGDVAADVLTSLIMRTQTLGDALRSLTAMLIGYGIRAGVGAAIGAITGGPAGAVAGAGMGIASSSLVVNVSATDAESFSRQLSQQDSGITKALRTASRRRRL